MREKEARGIAVEDNSSQCMVAESSEFCFGGMSDFGKKPRFFVNICFLIYGNTSPGNCSL
jgi:hypothetical protein